MKIVFLHDIKGIARVGDIKNVPDGYARNYLLPRQLAKIATDRVSEEVEKLKKLRDESHVRDQQQAQEIKNKLEGEFVEISEGANAEGNLYGSVDPKKIADAIRKKFHINLSPDQLDIAHHLKTTGEHKIKLNLFQTTATTFMVRVLTS